MAFKVSSSKLIKMTKLLQRAAEAINTLERLNQNKIVYLELKKELHEEIEETSNIYDLKNFKEWKKEGK